MRRVPGEAGHDGIGAGCLTWGDAAGGVTARVGRARAGLGAVERKDDRLVRERIPVVIRESSRDRRWVIVITTGRAGVGKRGGWDHDTLRIHRALKAEVRGCAGGKRRGEVHQSIVLSIAGEARIRSLIAGRAERTPRRRSEAIPVAVRPGAQPVPLKGEDGVVRVGAMEGDTREWDGAVVLYPDEGVLHVVIGTLTAILQDGRAAVRIDDDENPATTVGGNSWALMEGR